MNYIISQIIGGIAFIISLTTYHKKEKNQILLTAIISNILKLIHYLLLDATSGCITKIIGILRDIVIVKKEKYKLLSSNIIFHLFIITYILISISTYKNITSLLPLLAAFIYLIPIWNGDALTVKKAAFISSFLWLIYDISILSISGIISNLVFIISIFIALNKTKKQTGGKINE